MPETITKPKSWASRIYDLKVDETIYFPSGNLKYIKSLISGWFKRKYPSRSYKIQPTTDNISVTRLNDIELKTV